jgi:prepilin-type N-terminal cleavage/methylation domain-containing protein
MKKGFTLAEVLITLGIIGVVAAMTIPTLIQNTNSVKFASQFKKSVSTLSQAALMAQAQYDIDYSLLTDDSTAANCGSDTIADNKYTVCGLFNNTLAGQTFYGAYGTDNVKAANGTGKYTIAAR